MWLAHSLAIFYATDYIKYPFYYQSTTVTNTGVKKYAPPLLYLCNVLAKETLFYIKMIIYTNKTLLNISKISLRGE